ncbi:chaperonin 10-like protein [Xylariales sp. PMI_506]|nr:chaperonin 10-like protein [Xylariales sp. PMI_506]
MAQPLPEMMRALVCDGPGQPLVVKTVPTPQPTMGSAIVKVLFVQSQRSLQDILSGKIPFTFPQPLTPGNTGIGRVAAVGPDTTSLAVGQLVMLDTFICARDDPNVQILWGFWDGPSPTSKKFAAENWSMGSYAEFVRAPLENTWALDEQRLCGAPANGGLDYTLEDLAVIPEALVPYGGLRSLGLQAGETVIVAPATGGFSGAAVNVARAMGATVLAMGRNTAALQRVASRFPPGTVRPVPNTGDAQADVAALRTVAAGPIDAYLDFSPPQASASTHLRSCFLALRKYGRATMMGFITSDLPVSYMHLGTQNLTLRGQFMYERADVPGVIRLVEKGLLRLGAEGGYELRGKYSLDEIDECFRATESSSEAGQFVLIAP